MATEHRNNRRALEKAAVIDGGESAEQVESGGVIVNVQCSASDLMNELDARFCQMEAMLHITYGGGGDSFRAWSDEIQDNYLWHVTQTLQQTEMLWKRFTHLTRNRIFAKP